MCIATWKRSKYPKKCNRNKKLFNSPEKEKNRRMSERTKYTVEYILRLSWRACKPSPAVVLTQESVQGWQYSLQEAFRKNLLSRAGIFRQTLNGFHNFQSQNIKISLSGAAWKENRSMTLFQSRFIGNCTILTYAWLNPISSLHLEVTTISQWAILIGGSWPLTDWLLPVSISVWQYSWIR